MDVGKDLVAASGTPLVLAILREGELNEISIQEVKEALKKMRSGKAPGDDELPTELFKAAGQGGVLSPLLFITYIWTNV